MPSGDAIPLSAVDSAVGTGDSRLSDAREWTADTVGQAEAEAGTATTRRAWTAQRVRQAIAEWWLTASTDIGRLFVNANHADWGNSPVGSQVGWLPVVGNDKTVAYPQVLGVTGAALVNAMNVTEGRNALAVFPTTVTTTATSKTLANAEACTVTAAGLTITLPASPATEAQVSIGVLNFTNTVIARNGQNIMGLGEDMTIDVAHVTVTLLFVDSTRGWKIV